MTRIIPRHDAGHGAGSKYLLQMAKPFEVKFLNWVLGFLAVMSDYCNVRACL